MSKQPFVSIIIPCYNHEDFLDDCLASILNQTYQNIEILICDDCSPDNSYEKILSYKEKLENKFNNVVILKNEVNCGVTKNVNRMLKLAKGEFVKTIASDDSMAPNAISEMSGFKNVRSFNQAFKEYHQCTPSEYMKKYRLLNEFK